jgi:hypothetical protein
MKTLVQMLSLFVLVGALGVGVAEGQITNSVDFRASSPFIAGETTLPAGSYSIKPVSDFPGLLEISSVAHGTSVLVDTESTSSDTASKTTDLVFNKYGSQLVLTQLVLAGQTTGYSITSKYAEKRAAKAGPATKQVVHGTAK